MSRHQIKIKSAVNADVKKSVNVKLIIKVVVAFFVIAAAIIGGIAIFRYVRDNRPPAGPTSTTLRINMYKEVTDADIADIKSIVEAAGVTVDKVERRAGYYPEFFSLTDAEEQVIPVETVGDSVTIICGYLNDELKSKILKEMIEKYNLPVGGNDEWNYKISDK
ncbi:hypothetical protein FACS1894219_07210 [Clostridia bacterium]|nr:hypothetical protein FACS1894219_07210 [Clostridia bacterium]